MGEGLWTLVSRRRFWGFPPGSPLSSHRRIRGLVLVGATRDVDLSMVRGSTTRYDSKSVTCFLDLHFRVRSSSWADPRCLRLSPQSPSWRPYLKSFFKVCGHDVYRTPVLRAPTGFPGLCPSVRSMLVSVRVLGLCHWVSEKGNKKREEEGGRKVEVKKWETESRKKEEERETGMEEEEELEEEERRGREIRRRAIVTSQNWCSKGSVTVKLVS